MLGFFLKYSEENYLSSMSLEAANNLALSVTWSTKSDLHYFKRWIQTGKYEQIKGNKAFNCTPYATSPSRVCWNSGHFCRARSGAQLQPVGPPPGLGGVVIISLHNNPTEFIVQHHLGCLQSPNQRHLNNYTRKFHLALH